MPKFAHVTNSFNIMLTITAREFKANQQHYLDQVDAGEELIVERSQGRSYMVVPVTETDVMSETEYIMKPDEDLRRAISIDEFKEKVLSHIEELYSKEQ